MIFKVVMSPYGYTTAKAAAFEDQYAAMKVFVDGLAHHFNVTYKYGPAAETMCESLESFSSDTRHPAERRGDGGGDPTDSGMKLRKPDTRPP